MRFYFALLLIAMFSFSSSCSSSNNRGAERNCCLHVYREQKCCVSFGLCGIPSWASWKSTSYIISFAIFRRRSNCQTFLWDYCWKI